MACWGSSWISVLPCFFNAFICFLCKAESIYNTRCYIFRSNPRIYTSDLSYTFGTYAWDVPIKHGLNKSKDQKMKKSGKQLRNEIFNIVQEAWPIHVSGICKVLKLEGNISDISKVRYHVHKLKAERLVHTKKIDRALVAWPAEIDRLRVVHELLREK